MVDNTPLPQPAAKKKNARTKSAPHGQDVTGFEQLGEKQQEIDNVINDVHHGLSGVYGIIDQIAFLKSAIARVADDHRTLALANYALNQDLVYTQTRLDEKSAHFESVNTELNGLRTESEATFRSLDRAKTEIEALEHRHHLLGMAKRENDEQLSSTATQLSAAHDELEGLRMEIASLQGSLEIHHHRNIELTAKFNDTNNKAVLLSNRCEALEASLQQKVDDLLTITERFDAAFQEKESAVLYSQQKEQEAAQLRAEMTRLFQQVQQDKKARELQINQLSAELDGARSQIRMLEEVKGEAVADNERLTARLRLLEDQQAQSEVALNRLQTKALRLNTKLETTTNAKTHLEQSRATMSARLEAVTQSLYDSESDVKSLQTEIDRLTNELEKHVGTSSDTVEALNAKIFELEKEVANHRNEAAFYLSQIEKSTHPVSKAG